MIVYIVSDGMFTKIGLTNTSIKKRLKQLQTGNPHELTIIKTFNTNNSTKSAWMEQKLHNRFHKNRVRGEWFLFNQTQMIKVLKVAEEYLNHNAPIKLHK